MRIKGVVELYIIKSYIAKYKSCIIIQIVISDYGQ